MARSWEPVTAAMLDELDEPCRSCIEWQLGPRQASGRRPDRQRRLDLKRAWLDEVADDPGSVALLLRVDGIAVGHVICVPPAHTPRLDCFASAPVSPDALVLVAMHARDATLYKPLAQRAVRELVGRRVRAIEAFGGADRVEGCFNGPSATGAPCRLPVPLLERLGFQVVREHPHTPRYRISLDTVALSREQLAHAVAGISRVLRGAPAAEPSLGRQLPQPPG